MEGGAANFEMPCLDSPNRVCSMNEVLLGLSMIILIISGDTSVRILGTANLADRYLVLYEIIIRKRRSLRFDPNFDGFRKVDPDRWEFALEGFIGGQRHLLKTIKRRWHVLQSTRQQGGACVELGHYGLDIELVRLRRNRGLLVAEVARLRQQQQQSWDKIYAMEQRMQCAERKQQQMLAFLAKACNSPCFIRQLVRRSARGRDLRGVEIGHKRRLTATPSLENMQDEVTVAAIGRGGAGDSASREQEEMVTLESEMRTMFSAALDDESSSNMKEPGTAPVPAIDAVNQTILEELLSEDLMTGNPEEEILVGDQPEIDMEAEDLMGGARNARE